MTDPFTKTLRQTYRQVRQHLSPAYQQTISKKICARITQWHQYRHAKKIALYQAVHGEIDLTLLWQSAPLQGKYCYFPVLNEDRTLSFLPATPTTAFKENRFGIKEPDVQPEQALPLSQLDIIFVPLVAVDDKGTRLGMGAGYYDRTLQGGHTPLLIGVAYEFQRISFIMAREWDVPLNAVVTEHDLYWSKGSSPKVAVKIHILPHHLIFTD